MTPEGFPAIEVALADPVERAAFAAADVVIGHDRTRPGHLGTFFGGRRCFEHIVKVRIPLALTTKHYSYDSRTSSLEFFVAACNELRGGNDYRSGAEDDEWMAFMHCAWQGRDH